jgi:DNA repair exonuclease SbcCD nuclease subunit
MNAIHCADLHIGESRHILPDVYLERQTKMLYQILSAMKENKAKFLIVAGDIFHKGEPSQTEKDAFIKWIVKVDDYCLEADAWAIYDEGNHDAASSDKTALDTIRFLRTKLKRILVVLKPTMHVLHNYAFACIPWNYDLVKTAKKLHAELNQPVKKFFVVGHLPLPGITTDSGWFIKGSHKLLSLDFVDAFFLGDIHARFISECGRLQMPGAPMQHNWGDKLPKGISLVNLNKPLTPQLLELDVTKFEVTKDIAKAKRSKNIVKYVGQVNDEELPDNVVEVVSYLDEKEVADYASEFNVVEGLPEFLAEKGCSKKQQLSAIKLIEKLCGEL